MALHTQNQLACLSVGINSASISEAGEYDVNTYLFNLLNVIEQAYPNYQVNLSLLDDQEKDCTVEVYNAHLNFVHINKDFALIKYRELQEQLRDLVIHFIHHIKIKPNEVAATQLNPSEIFRISESLKRAKTIAGYQQKIVEINELLKSREGFIGCAAHLNFATPMQIFINNAKCETILIAKPTISLLVIEQMIAVLEQVGHSGTKQGRVYIEANPNHICQAFGTNLDFKKAVGFYEADQQSKMMVREFIKSIKAVDSEGIIVDVEEMINFTYFCGFLRGAAQFIAQKSTQTT